MSDYTKTTNFTAKDALSSGDPDKLIKGSLFDTEFDNIATAIGTKYDSNDIASQAEAEAEALNTVLMTPLRVANWADANGGMVGDIQALADPNADRILFWDDSAGAAALLTVSTGLTLSGTNLTTNDGAIVHDSLSGFVANEHIDHSAVSITAGTGLTGGGTIAATRTLNLDISGLTGFSGQLSAAGDGFLIDDAGTMKRLAYNDACVAVQSVSGTTDTIATADLNTYIKYTNASAVAVTLNTGVGEVGNVLIIEQGGAGQVTVGGTATVNAAIGLKTRTQYSVIVLVCVAANTWTLYGDAAA